MFISVIYFYCFYCHVAASISYRVKKKIIIKKRKNKKEKKKIISSDFYIQFKNIAYWQHADLVRSGFEKKTLLIMFTRSLTCLIHEVVTKRCYGKKAFLLSTFNLCKTSVEGSYFSEIAGFLN